MVLCQGAVISTAYHIGRILTVCAHIQTGLRPPYAICDSFSKKW